MVKEDDLQIFPTQVTDYLSIAKYSENRLTQCEYKITLVRILKRRKMRETKKEKKRQKRAPAGDGGWKKVQLQANISGESTVSWHKSAFFS